MTALELWTRQSNLFNQIFSELERNNSRRAEAVPSVDIKESEDSYHFFVDLPGINQEDIDIEVSGNQMTIQAKRAFENDQDPNGDHRVFQHSHLTERFQGVFKRSFHLPDGVDQERVGASYKSGVLHLTIEKKPEIKPRKINVVS